MNYTVTLKALRPGLPKVANGVLEKYDRYIVTKRGRPVMVIINPEDLESMIETIEILSDKSAIKRIKKARKEAISGRTISLQDLQKKLDRV